MQLLLKLFEFIQNVYVIEGEVKAYDALIKVILCYQNKISVVKFLLFDFCEKYCVSVYICVKYCVKFIFTLYFTPTVLFRYSFVYGKRKRGSSLYGARKRGSSFC